MNKKQNCYKKLISKDAITFDDVLEYTKIVGRTPPGGTWSKIIRKSKELQKLLQDGFILYDIRYALKYGLYPEKHYCVVDGKEIHADSKLRYKKTCSKECEKKLHEQINLELYGNICPLKSDIFKKKSEQTKLRKYGNAHYVNPEKAKQTVMNKPEEVKRQEIQKRINTRNENILKNPNYWKDIERKSKETKVRNGHDENWNNREKAKNTCLQRYGVEYYLQTDEVKLKSENTCLQKYGVKSYTQTEEYREKSKETCLEKYGVEFSGQSDEVKEKSKKTCLEKYGVEFSLQSPEVREKITDTMLERYGVEYAQQSDQIRKKGQKKYYYNDIMFDSKPELAVYIYLIDNNINFIFQPENKFEYVVDEFGKKKTHFYYADFYLSDYDKFIEIKGSYFFTSDGKMFCPYRDSSWSDEQYYNKCKIFEEKQKCMIRNDVQIILDTSECMKIIMKYIDVKYGKNYILKFKSK